MVKRRITLKIYVLAFIITVAIFLLGVYVGQLVDTRVSEDLMTELKYYNEESVSLEIMLLLGDSPSFCPLYLEESDVLEQNTIQLGEQLTYLEETKGIYDDELKKQYFLLETKAYLLAGKVNEMCKTNKTLVLYFYSKDCGECEMQGEILDEVVEESDQEIRIYSFDGESDSAVVKSLKNKYYIAEYPTLVVDGITKKGLREKDELLSILE